MRGAIARDVTLSAITWTRSWRPQDCEMATDARPRSRPVEVPGLQYDAALLWNMNMERLELERRASLGRVMRDGRRLSFGLLAGTTGPDQPLSDEPRRLRIDN
jgi:hypothetical protein